MREWRRRGKEGKRRDRREERVEVRKDGEVEV